MDFMVTLYRYLSEIGKEKNKAEQRLQKIENYKNELKHVNELKKQYTDLQDKLKIVVGCLETVQTNFENGGYILDGVPYKKKEIQNEIYMLNSTINLMYTSLSNLNYRKEELEKKIG